MRGEETRIGYTKPLSIATTTNTVLIRTNMYSYNSTANGSYKFRSSIVNNLSIGTTATALYGTLYDRYTPIFSGTTYEEGSSNITFQIMAEDEIISSKTIVLPVSSYYDSVSLELNGVKVKISKQYNSYQNYYFIYALIYDEIDELHGFNIPNKELIFKFILPQTFNDLDWGFSSGFISHYNT